MTCREFDEHVEARLADQSRAALANAADGDLGGIDLAELLEPHFFQHMQRCDECRKRVRESVWLARQLAELFVKPPSGRLADQVVAELKRLDRDDEPAVAAAKLSRFKKNQWLARIAVAASASFAALVVHRALRHDRLDANVVVAVAKPTASSEVPQVAATQMAEGKPQTSPLARGILLAVRSQSAYFAAQKGVTASSLTSTLPEVDLRKRIAAKAEDLTVATRSVGVGIRPVADSAERAFAFLWPNASQSNLPQQ